MTRLVEFFKRHIKTLVEAFREWGCDASPTFQYWGMSLKGVEIMLTNVRAELDGNYSTSSHMLLYFFVAKRTNYSRWMLAFILDILELPAEIRSAFEAGQCVIRQTSGKFNGVWRDMGTQKNY